MNEYIFRDQYGTLCYEGSHFNEEEAWIGFWNECKYPESDRNKERDIELGMKVEVF